MQRLAETCERIAATTKKTEKTAIVADYLRSRELGDAAISAVFLSGRAFPAFDERTLQIGGALLWKLVVELASGRESALSAAYRKRGDLGSAAADVLFATAPAVEHDHARRSTLDVRRDRQDAHGHGQVGGVDDATGSRDGA